MHLHVWKRVDFNGHAIGIEGYHGHQWTSLDVHGYP
jgi:hypothetical protein